MLSQRHKKWTCRLALHTAVLTWSVKQNAVNANLKAIDLTRLGIKPGSPAPQADALYHSAIHSTIRLQDRPYYKSSRRISHNWKTGNALYNVHRYSFSNILLADHSHCFDQWFLDLSKASNPISVMQACTKHLPKFYIFWTQFFSTELIWSKVRKKEMALGQGCATGSPRATTWPVTTFSVVLINTLIFAHQSTES